MSINDHLPADLPMDGEWETVLDQLYAVFLGTFVDNPVRFNGRKVIYDKRKIDDGREEGFWHLITRKDKATGDRLPDYPRARKLCWLRPICENRTEEGVACWRHQEDGGAFRVYIWLEELDYVIILEELTYVYKLVTTFVIDDHNKWLRRELEKKQKRGVPI